MGTVTAGDDGWEERMAAKARTRREARERGRQDDGDIWGAIPVPLAGELPPGEPDITRDWCTSCGLPDAPVGGKFDPAIPCPRCGCPWRWHGRLADRDGTGEGPPDDGTCAATATSGSATREDRKASAGAGGGPALTAARAPITLMRSGWPRLAPDRPVAHGERR